MIRYLKTKNSLEVLAAYLSALFLFRYQSTGQGNQACVDQFLKEIFIITGTFTTVMEPFEICEEENMISSVV